ncbi:PREDICTED: disintegrin and metalloproteinase domain-containing protein 18-like [Myotis brandtii]|uniref:disintegrin and metalloproteinase domain-containing protein 18-like n=1 Tax=Myotis brandtii TaxID=109478 RepID=UPI000704070B|nr:PREDICTED: disintegrin and metalloproteinase domain-containing protein 18-like [Myotis brandtii]
MSIYPQQSTCAKTQRLLPEVFFLKPVSVTQPIRIPQDSEGIFLQVTVPCKIRSNESEGIKRQVIYNITIDKKPYTLYLTKSSFLSQDFLVYTFNETGSLHTDSSYFKMHCHYQGYAANFPNSAATLSICSGLRGFLQFENISYGIEPLESSARFEHIIYQVKNNNTDIPMLIENYSNIWQKNQTYKSYLISQEKTLSKLLPQYLEMHIIVEKALYDYMGSEMMAVTQKIIQIIGLVNTMFTQLKLTVILSSLELWSDKNQISTIGDVDELSKRFLAWKRDDLILRPHDITFLLIYRKHPKYMGTTFSGMICNKSYDADIAVYTDAITLEGFSVIIAQLLGLKIGLTYNTNECSCPRATCIMNHEAECQFKKCCDYNTCKLKGSVKCGSGLCCTPECQISVAGTPCRKSADQECDFTEYCNGTYSDCVPDTYALNGHVCGLGTAFCYKGRCQTTDYQCANIFGKGAEGAPFACFEEINSFRGRFGNCGFKNSQPLPCEPKDVLCGKLACVWPQKNTYKNNIQSAIYSYTQGHVCLSIPTGLSVRSDGRDYGYVADGTVCGTQMYCENKTCQEIDLKKSNCNATTKCKGNGICNNLGNCHCFPGYRPPDCEFQIGSPGGSIDDGNVQKSAVVVIKKDYNAHQDNWRFLSFFLVFPFFIFSILIIMKLSETRKLCNKKNPEFEGNSTTAPESNIVDSLLPRTPPVSGQLPEEKVTPEGL